MLKIYNYVFLISILIKNILLNHLISNNTKLAFQINCLYQQNKGLHLKKIHFIKCNKYLLQKFFLDSSLKKIFQFNFNKYLFYKIKNDNFYQKYLTYSGFLNSFISLDTYINGLKYHIANFQTNHNIKTIKVIHHQNLYIPTNILIKYLHHLLGMPINYTYLNSSLKKIHQWYIYKGFKWLKIYYSYEKINKLLTLEIYEGIIRDIYILNDTNKDREKNFSNILNQVLQKELNLYYGKILNINLLEFNILEFKKIYPLYEIKYNITYKYHGLTIKIQYIVSKENISSFKFLSSYDVHYNFIYFYFYQNIKKNYMLKYLINYFTHKICNESMLITSPSLYLYSWKIKYSLKYFIHIIIYYKVYLIKLSFLLTNLFLYIVLYTNLIFNYNNSNKLYHDLDILNYQYLNNKTTLPYLYGLQIHQFNIHIKYKYLLSQKFIFQQIESIYKYMNILNYHNNISYINIKTKNKSSSLTFSKHILKYKIIPISFIQFLEKKYMINMYYQTFIYYLNPIIDLFMLHNYLIHTLKLNYQTIYNLRSIPLKGQKLSLFIEINLLIGTVQKYLFLISNNIHDFFIDLIQKKYNVFISLEYLLIQINHNYIYLFIRYLPKFDHHSITSLYVVSYDNIEFNNINTGVGIQLNLSIKYMPIVRLEFMLVHKNLTTFYTYITNKLYI